MKRYFDAAIIVPLEEEFQILLEKFGYSEELHSETQVRFAGTMAISNVTFLLIQQNKMGKGGMQEAASSCLQQFDVGLLICVGIAGGISSDLKIGDVCYTGSIADVLGLVEIHRELITAAAR